MSARVKKALLTIAVLLVILYLAAVASLAWAMSRPPETFGRYMSKMPVVGYIVLPF